MPEPGCSPSRRHFSGPHRPGCGHLRRSGHHPVLRYGLRRQSCLPHRVLYRPAQRGHDGSHHRRDHAHLPLFHGLHVSGSRISPVSRDARYHDRGAPLHGVQRQPGHVICLLADPLVAAVSACTQPRACRHTVRRDEHVYDVAAQRCGVSGRYRPGLFAVRHIRVPDIVCPRRGHARHPVPLAGPRLGDERRDGGDPTDFRRRHGQVGTISDPHLAAALLYAPTPIHALLHAGIINAGDSC